MPGKTFREDLKSSSSTKRSLLAEFRRKGVHLFALVIPIGYILVPRKPALLILGGCAFAAAFLDLLKYYDRGFRRIFYKIFGKMLRSKEIKRFTASTYILGASLIVFFAFDRWVALISITYIILGDTAGAIFGVRFGKHKTIGKKTLEGSMAFFVAAYAGSILLKLLVGINAPWSALFMGALSAAVIESLPLGIDDNLTVPVLTGLLLQMMYIGLF